MPINSIVFDAGDTLILVDTPDEKPLVEWPVLNAVPGAKEILDRLDGKYQLVVGSNADVSTGAMMTAALNRVEMGRHFSKVFSSVDLGLRKPDPAFFQTIEKALSVSPDQIVMVGDSYTNDILGAVQVGWHAVWYNPTGKAAPGLAPRHDAEISDLEELPDTLQHLNLPTIDQARSWVIEQNGEGHLLEHVEMVAALAYQMAVWLRQAGEKVNPVLVHRGGLLHDLAKTPARREDLDHGLLAAEMLRQRKQLALAEIAERHVLFSLLNPQRQPTTWEEILVYFADKLVEKGQIVSFHERLAAMQQRYQMDTPQAQWERFVSAISATEAEIYQSLGWNSAALLENLKSAYAAAR